MTRCSSRHLVDRVKDESIRIRSPNFANVFVGREVAEGLEPGGEVVGGIKVGEVHTQLTEHIPCHC